MKNQEFLSRILSAFDEGNIGTFTERLSWSNGHFFINCSDVFDWACAECEEISPENIDVLESCIADIRAVSPKHLYKAPVLFCCRVRSCRPQGAMYDYLPTELWSLFDACGPKREVGFGNPKEHPKERPQEERNDTYSEGDRIRRKGKKRIYTVQIPLDTNGEKNSIMAFVVCGKKAYFVGIGGNLLSDWERV